MQSHECWWKTKHVKHLRQVGNKVYTVSKCYRGHKWSTHCHTGIFIKFYDPDEKFYHILPEDLLSLLLDLDSLKLNYRPELIDVHP